ncbi:hypothetical protein FSP39_024046 [Pinctada imbricata]|uniref:F-box domain-containing protein n=1 Tax=Pinctada imbricata TaxID=66713 RepID=A0AA89BSM5_PINIB|nr:hypothetical protein FSP39_024046 [Pinctada imbricata]
MHEGKFRQELEFFEDNQVCPVSKTIDGLPDELLARIFKYLHPIYDRLPLAGLVCRKWRQVLHDNGSLWRKIYVDPLPYQHGHFGVLVTVLRVYGYHIQQLSWRQSSPVYQNIFALIPNLKNLRCLRLPILWTRAVINSVSSLTQLERVQINGGYALSDEDLLMVAQSFPLLKEVSLNACWRVTARGLDVFISLLKQIEIVKLKINSGLRLNDPHSANAIVRGCEMVQMIASKCLSGPQFVKTLCLHYIPLEMEQLWSAIKYLPNLKKLSISNCEELHGIRLLSDSLQTLCLFNIWNALFISIDSSSLRNLTIDHGLDSLEHLEVDAPNLRRSVIDGNNVLMTIRIKSNRLLYLEISNCENVDMATLRNTLRNSPNLISLRIGCISPDSLTLDEYVIPNIQELCLLGDFACETIHIRSPTLRLIHAEAENDLVTLNHLYVTANHLCKVALIGMPALRTLTIQCVSVDAIEMNLCSDDQLNLESCVIHALNAIGFLRLFDCKVNLFSLSTPLAQTVVLYRCQMSDYALRMALMGCHNISHLNLEKCKQFRTLVLETPLMKFLNIFGCSDVRSLDLADCPKLLALNMGQCCNVKIVYHGKERSLEELCQYMQLVPPKALVRWSHDYPPQPYMCS